jgi:aminopeptidase YwaD
MHSGRRFLFACVVALWSCFPAVAQNADLNPRQYLEDVKELTTPAMEGRGDGNKGLARAEHLIVERYKKLGLRPAGSNGYLQPFTVITGARLQGGNHLALLEKQKKTELKLNEDYVPFSFSSSGLATAGIVFAGYGITADEFHYDDYAGVDVKDKIVLVLRYEPVDFGGKTGMTIHSQLFSKAINARNHGAKAIVLLNGKPGPGEQDLLIQFGSVSGPTDVGILLLQMKNAAADKLLPAGKTLAKLQEQIDKNLKPASFALGDDSKISLQVGVEHTRAQVNNVLAYLPGETDEYVIVGAHYDHLGRGNFDSLAPSQIGQIHPGADDNASGTAGTLELARHFARLHTKLRRGILFANFAGEELGLLGSEEWVKHPTRPIEKAVAMLNMDMIGRIKDDKIFVGGVGTGSSFAELLKGTQTKAHLNVEYSLGGYSSSDHTSFLPKHIPVLFFFSGLHSDYHKPSDTWDKINAEAAVRLLGLVADVSEQLAYASNKPEFKVVAEEQPPAGHQGGIPSGGGGYGPYFGSIPDFGQVETGVKFSDVKPNSPAAKAGFRGGDILVQFGDKEIKNLYDFTDALRRSKVGDVVEVKVLRDGKPVTAKVTLEQRR